MKKSAFRKRLSEAVPGIPDAFEQTIKTTLDGITADEQTAAGAHSRRTGGMMRKILVFALVAALLLAASALAASLLGLNVFEGTIGESPVNADSVIQYDLVKRSYNECDIEVRQAAYDGMTLFVVYSIRERDATDHLGIWDEALGAYTVRNETFPAMQRDGIGNWYDGLWIDGEYVRMPQMSSQIAYGSETPGELLFYNMYRLDQEEILLNGEAVEIALAIGEGLPLEDLQYDEETGSLLLPETGLITFTMDCSVRSGISIEHPRIPTVLDDFTVETEEVVYSPIQLYITLSLQANPGAMDAYFEEHGEGFMDEDGYLMWAYSEIDLYEGWIRSLKLVDGNGSLVEGAYHRGGIYGSGYSDTEAWYTFPYLETYPDEMYLAPVINGAADMAQAVRVK